MKYRTHPEEVEAFQITDDVGREEGWPDWAKKARKLPSDKPGAIVPVLDTLSAQAGFLFVHTLGGVTAASPGQWIVRDKAGNLSVRRDKDFQATYEPFD